MVAPSPLPDLPQRHLLTALLELNADLPAVAARTRTPLDDLTRWAHTDAVHAWVEAHNHFAAIAREHRELSRVTRNLDDLEKLAAATDNPIEKRRILTALIRASTAILSGRASRNSPSRREGTGGWVRATQDSTHHHSRNSSAVKQLSERPVGVSSFDAPTLNTGPATGTPTVSAHPRPTTAPSVPSVPPILPDPSALPDLLLTPFVPPPALPSSRNQRKHTAAHLLAAAGLPAP